MICFKSKNFWVKTASIQLEQKDAHLMKLQLGFVKMFYKSGDLSLIKKKVPHSSLVRISNRTEPTEIMDKFNLRF